MRSIATTFTVAVLAVGGFSSDAHAIDKVGCKDKTAHQCKVKRAKIHKIHRNCNTWTCVKRVNKVKAKRLAKEKRREWKYWTSRYIPACTWGNESSHGNFTQQFADWRYGVMNSRGSGARGKYQLMPTTKAAYDKYGDWSKLDQEIAAHQLFWAQGIGPWAGCH